MSNSPTINENKSARIAPLNEYRPSHKPERSGYAVNWAHFVWGHLLSGGVYAERHGQMAAQAKLKGNDLEAKAHRTWQKIEYIPILGALAALVDWASSSSLSKDRLDESSTSSENIDNSNTEQGSALAAQEGSQSLERALPQRPLSEQSKENLITFLNELKGYNKPEQGLEQWTSDFLSQARESCQGTPEEIGAFLLSHKENVLEALNINETYQCSTSDLNKAALFNTSETLRPLRITINGVNLRI